MLDCTEKRQLEIMAELANILASDADATQVMKPVVNFIKTVLAVDKICAVVFSGNRDERIFCDKGESCDYCGESEKIIEFAKRVTSTSLQPLTGEKLLQFLSEEEKNRFQLKNPCFFPIILKGRLFGALWYSLADCEGADCRLTLLERMNPLVGVAFRDVFYYESQLGQEMALIRILDNLDANIYVSDIETDEILFINKKMMEEFGLTGDVTGQKCWKVLQEGMTERCPFCPSSKLARNADYQAVWEEHNTATKKYYKNTDSAIKWLDGRLVHLQHSVDITVEKEAMTKLEEAKAQAEQASRAKGDFLSRMSHEIRTPINAIIGMARIAESSSNLDKAHECVKKIDSSSKQLLSIINDILDMSKIEANKMELVAEPFDFEKMLIDVSNVISIKSEEKKQRLHIHMDTAMPRFFRGDEMRIAQVMNNLLSNAVKFTPDEGIVRMNVHEKEAFEKASLIEVQVSDNGIGIAKDQQRSLFQSFEQADGGIARKFGGTGLGLAISKNIVEMMGGTISVESAQGAGSTFTFTIRLEHAPPTVAKTETFKGIDIPSLRVLLLEEVEETRAYFLKIMDSFGIKADTASTVSEAFRMLGDAKRSEENYNIIFVDWDVSPDTGAELCNEIKKQFGSSIIVLLSASQMGEFKARVGDFGISKYIPKPFFPSTIFDVINEVVGLPAKKSDVAALNRYLFAGYHILLVEDLEINREVIYQILEDTRIKISSAPNGKVAVSMFMQSPESYDLILMDINMPEMDGYEATLKIRSLPLEWAQKIPILAMTANAFAEDVKKSLAVGMNDHIAKPIKFELLFNKLHAYLSDHARNKVKQGEEKRPTQEGKDAMDDFNDIRELVDVKDGLGRVKGNAKVYKTLLNSFLKHSRFEELKDEFARRDEKAATATAHTIKGVSANISLVAINKSIVLLEEKLKNGSFDDSLLEASLESFAKTKIAIEKILEKL